MKDLQPVIFETLKTRFIKASSVKHRQALEKKKHVYKKEKETTHLR